ncbi:MAG: hypothetical protein GWP16_04980, partial [Nitrospirae bacterium]|nr:hypothetical protein [Nitrospirota bacterium]
MDQGRRVDRLAGPEAIELLVAFPHLPENSRPVGESGDVPIDQVVIGSCTN